VKARHSVAGPFPLPLAAPARVSHTRLGRRSRPLFWGRHPYEGGGGSGKRGKKKVERGQKKDSFFGGRARSLQATRLSAGPTPSHLRPPYPRRAYSSWGSSLVLGVYTWPRGVHFAQGALDTAPLVIRPRVRARAAKPKRKLPNT